jgi:hypothetical protein
LVDEAGGTAYICRERAQVSPIVDLKSLKKLEPMPASSGVSRADNERLLVLVKLREGAARPAYISPRAEMGPQIFSAEITAGQLASIESDPAIESVSISQRLPLIE